jgi:formylglycine-generating enzyme required for sulfatase activity
MAKGLVPYVAAGPTLTALKALAARPMTAAEREQMKRDKSLASRSLQWVKIPGGSFMMGTSDFSNTQPAHQVTVHSFEMSKTLVTNKQYQACVKAGACTANDDKGQAFDGDDQPVVGVDWNQARAFAKWVGGRLPSEAEWEYAARSAGKDYKYPWGNSDANCDNAVIDGCGWNATAPVCSKPAGNTEQGLCDMAGNVWEWVEDWYHDSYNGAPADGSAWVDPAGSNRVNRGGSWYNVASNARSSNRFYDDPGNEGSNRGFRLAR